MRVTVDATGLKKWLGKYSYWCGGVVLMTLMRPDLKPSFEDVMVLVFLPIPLMALCAGAQLLHLLWITRR
jgi:hypothetical protein